ncbi:hypothetical protein PVAND_007463 [Polypedilum vanderplanki]|uniref:Dynein axonemal intermediate chain 4 n=1 Tax=Polypedilum vanderplanki TaxID=319348 RepID=A0A9J6C6D5_POLVA|nr:hypothetical protein PVAND_007463 [Polypedilum vanderplanki]
MMKEKIIKQWKTAAITEVKSDVENSDINLPPIELKKDVAKSKANRARFKEFIKEIQGTNKKIIERKTIFVAENDADKKKNLAYYDRNIYNILKLRKQTDIIHNGRNVTPKFLTESDITDVEESYTNLDRKQRTDSLWDILVDSFRKPIDRVDSVEILDVETTIRHIKEDRKAHPSAKKPKNFIKLKLTETDDVILYESVSLTELRGTEEATEVEKYNTDYEYLTKGPGKNRRTCNAEVQTENILVKSRSSNTERIKKQDQESFVSNFEMFDTYADLAKRTKEIQLDDESQSKFELTTYSKEGENIDEVLNANQNFHLSSMILQRLLAGNIYRERQKRFRNMIERNPLDLNLKYLYRLQNLWTYKSSDTQGKNVVDMSWCRSNSDLLAVGYGTYYYCESKERNSGAVLIWSIKNPVNPERCYRYDIPVTAVEFSSQNPQLLAVALYDGTVEVLDVTDININVHHNVVAKSERITSPGFEPIWQIQWITLKDKEFIITASQDGRIMKYEIATGPFLVAFHQLRLNRVEGTVEALNVEHKKSFIEADRHPQALCLRKHPLTSDIYFVGTDEGVIHVCSMNFPHQHLNALQVHNGGVYVIDYSPFSPKIFLTTGSDWVIRLWIEDILEPIIELYDGFQSFHTAQWSPVHSTIIASCTENSIQIWDLRRKSQKPASVRRFESRKLTIVKFTPCGRSLLIGDDQGNVDVCSLEDFPFPPHFQFDELQRALFKSLTNKQTLEKQVRQLGHLGYEKEQKR